RIDSRDLWCATVHGVKERFGCVPAARDIDERGGLAVWRRLDSTREHGGVIVGGPPATPGAEVRTSPVARRVRVAHHEDRQTAGRRRRSHVRRREYAHCRQQERRPRELCRPPGTPPDSLVAILTTRPAAGAGGAAHLAAANPLRRTLLTNHRGRLLLLRL